MYTQCFVIKSERINKMTCVQVDTYLKKIKSYTYTVIQYIRISCQQ